MIPIGSQLKKTAIFLLITTLVIGYGASVVDWNNPESGDAFKGTITLNASTTDSNWVKFWWEQDTATTEIDNTTSPFNTDWNSDSAARGSLTLIAGHEGTNETIDVTYDPKDPEVESKTPEEYTNDDSPTVKVTGTDENSDVSEVELEAEGQSDSGTTSASVELEDLDDGDYTANYNITDEVGNTANGDWTFTVDTSYDGDTSPTFSPSESIMLMDDEDDDQAFDVTLEEEDEDSEIQVKCFDGSDDEFDSTGFKDVDEDTVFTCDLDADDYGGEEVEVWIEVCDEAGNCEELDDESKKYYLDAEAPNIETLEISSGASSFNSNFDVDLSVTDDATDLERVEYYFDTGIAEGEGTSFDYSSDTDTYEIDVSGLNSGTKTLYVRAKDEAGRWSSSETLEFDYYPQQEPEIGLDHPESLSVTAGDSGSFDLAAENTGEFYLPEVPVSINDTLMDKTVNFKDLKTGDSKTNTVNFDTSEEDLGEYSLSISSETPEYDSSMKLVVEATAEQKQDIDSNLIEYQGKLDDLEKNITELGLSEDRQQELESNISDFRDSIRSASDAVNTSEYYKANMALKDIDQKFNTAYKAYQEVKDKVEEERKNKMVLAAAVLLMLATGAGIGGFLLYMRESDEMPDFMEDIGLPGEIPELGIVDKMKDLLNRAEDEIEEETGYSFEGFD